MNTHAPIHSLVDLTDSHAQTLLNMSIEEARRRVASGDAGLIRGIDGHFALVGRQDHLIRMARTLSIPMRYFIAKAADGPALIVTHRIDTIQQHLQQCGLADQFHPSYTRMVPAHHVTQIALVGCPDPNPSYRRFFTPDQEALPDDIPAIGERYIGQVCREIGRWLTRVPSTAPVGVCFSGGIDSGAVLLLTYHSMLNLGMNPSRLKAFTLAVDGRGEDSEQARRFLKTLDLELFLETIPASSGSLDLLEIVRIVEDYKPLDVQSAGMMLALCRGIRERYPQWTHLLDGDGGDENLKDYPIEENSELTIRSVLGNRLLYHEGWGVEAIKHSLTYSGGLSRACTRGFAPASAVGFRLFSPFTLPSVVGESEAIPFIRLTDWSPQRLYALKGLIVAAGVEAITGLTMPVYPKRRFQHGAGDRRSTEIRLPTSERACRSAFREVCGA